MSQVIMYKGFERFWHWTQALLIIVLLFSGFNLHGTHQFFAFEQAVNIHIISAWLLMGLWVFAIFWHLTTGEWKQYIPSSANKIIAMMKYYAMDIFLGGGHPHHKTRKEKLNPMQRMAYLSLHLVISPGIWISGLLYLFYPYWSDIGIGSWSLGGIALIHTAAAFALMAFLVVHLYLALTTSKEPLGYLKAMITGYEQE
ncbi:MAG: cytochrome b/b6 domain-containing protein [gamma proteobacterium symbiont of Bathyaustriella thionipta]|nr:cytochrome b/b6 domain-containing protein [gamma proteobacterium symbiont of Bathyaustriella thionipta]MCU7948783.1 cytochrome b/b6 domain-containing protein [gamma proteobacterium symbiont of Bathyaustriella thionipta]MCU7954980.1 cytochrome b/b6 domain-containing protein [gamma proteobacterium symbiont of Bathyaustriella thionipta]MCU7955308.1 cytochrome b/b6 domain-containing protein [gamma proteobacterium symbiont of Bathyaustriella thionipta]MCU7967075.1 cytochrome b/b6 domain-containin